jgi:hypothetical protein
MRTFPDAKPWVGLDLAGEQTEADLYGLILDWVPELSDKLDQDRPHDLLVPSMVRQID